jgi:hypothetical protein
VPLKISNDFGTDAPARVVDYVRLARYESAEDESNEPAAVP